MTTLGYLHPPVIEVVCGVIFKPLPLDLIDFGVYWARRRNAYPRREMHPAIMDSPQIMVGLGAMRLWLVSEPKEFIVQLQSDRFYMNWQRREGPRPCYNDKSEHNIAGLRGRFIQELESYKGFCDEFGRHLLQIERVEVIKIDELKGDEVLASVRALNWRAAAGMSALDNISMNLAGDDEQGSLSVALRGDASRVRMETRVVLRAEGDPIAALDRANERVNGVFQSMFEDDGVFRRNHA